MRIILSLTLLLIFINAAAQLGGQSFIDSLVKEIPHTKDDTSKARLYKKIAELYSNSNPIEAMKYADTGMKHVVDMKWEKGIAVFYNLTGNLYNDKGEYVRAIDLFNRAYLIHTTNKEVSNAASVLNNIGTTYLRQSVFDKAARNYFDALKLAESISNNALTATCLSNIAAVYFNQNDYSKSLEYQFRSLNIDKAENNKDGIADGYAAIGNTYLQKKDTLNARKYYTDALAYYQQTENNTGVASVYSNLSILFTDYAINLDYKLKAQQIWNNSNPAHTLSISNLGNIALAYLDIVRYDTLHKIKPSSIIPATRNGLLQKAQAYLNYAFTLNGETGDMGNLAFLTGIRSELDAEKGDFKKAYYDVTTYHAMYDSIYSQENKNKIASIEGQREVTIREKEIELGKLALSAQKKQRIALITGIGMLCIIGILLYRQNRARKKTNTTLLKLNTELDEANKIKAQFFAILSHDLRSPVANLVDLLRLQKDEPGLLSAEQTELHQQKIATVAETLLENMETMLLWSKEQMKNFRPQMKSVAVNSLFGYIDKFFSTQDQIKFIFTNSENLQLITDENYLQTIMQNLTANAVKALRNTNNATIEWNAFQKDGKIVLSVTDNGPGIKDEFTRILHTPTTATNAKTGFGLVLIRDLATAIQCSITVQSSPGEKTTFYLFG